MLILIITIKDIVNKLSNSFVKTVGKIMHNIAIYTINIYDIILKIFSDFFNILSISSLFLFAIGLYKTDFITTPNPDSNSVIYARNCVIDTTNPFTLEPKLLIISLGTIKLHTIVTNCNINDEIILVNAFLLLIFSHFFLYIFQIKYYHICFF